MAPVTRQTKANSTKLIRDILGSQFDRQILDISPEKRSNNSKIYILSLEPAQNNNNNSNRQAGRPGVVPLPLDATKAVIRFTDPSANLNDDVQVQNEVASMSLARQALASMNEPLIPDVYGWSSATDGLGWVLMQFMPGSPMPDKAFNQMDQYAKGTILKQIAQVLKCFQEYELPSSVTGYGGLGFDDDGGIINGPTSIHGATSACGTYQELYSQYLQTQLKFMDQCKVVKGWKDTDLRARIDEFVTNGFKPLIERISEPQLRRTLVHGDFDIHNILYNPETNDITAVLDFQFSHVASAADEYFYSLDRIQGLVSPPVQSGGKRLLREYLLHGFEDDAVEHENEDMVDWNVAVMRDEAFRLANVQRPVDMQPNMDPLSELYWFIQNISPAWFLMPGFLARAPKESIEQYKQECQDDVERILSGWGY